MKTISLKLAAAFLLLAANNAKLSTVRAQGSLAPPGAPAPMFKTLQQVEPRTPIEAVPFTITRAGSYYLTTNLTVVGANGDGITINADNVTLDLRGFVISGDGALNNSGIQVTTAHRNICVRNGTVMSIGGGNGITASKVTSGTFESLRLVGSGLDGLLAGTNATVVNCLVWSNLTDGITAGPGATIRDCTVAQNRFYGISTGPGSTVRDCTIANNTLSDGLIAGEGSAIRGCTVSQNNYGISLANRSSVNDCQVVSNMFSGIRLASACYCANNTAMANGSSGIQAYSLPSGLDGYGNRIDSNHVRDNSGFGINLGYAGDGGTLNILIRNTAGNNFGGAYSLGSGNKVGPIVSDPASPSANAWANIQDF